MPDRLWFFDGKLRYAAEIAGIYLGDSADGRDLLVADPNGQVIEVRWNADGVVAKASRQFTWKDGTAAFPVALYDDLRRGFFSHNGALVLAGW